MKKLTADDPETRSADVVASNIEQLKALFPEAVGEGGIDFDVLKQLLGAAVDQREEKYGLNWYGKRRGRQLALTPSNGTLRPSPEDSVDWDTTQNVMIEGDNLEVLKLLQKSYSGKVKLIYIDPPYNTGGDFVYPDKYEDNLATYLRYTRQVSEEGFKVSSNTEASGRFHTNWLNMMSPRLRLARQLLRPDGAIFCSIEDTEVARLRMILDEVFGEENFLAQFTWRTDGNFDNQAKIKICHEYILLYARSADDFPHPPVVDPSTPSDSKLFRPEIRNTVVKNGPKNPVSTIVLPAGFPADFMSGTIPVRTSPWPAFGNDAVVVDGTLLSPVEIRSGWSSKELVVEFIAGGCKSIRDSKGQETSFVLTRTGAVEAVKKRSDIQSHVISVLSGFGGAQKASAQLAEIGAFFNGYPKPVDLMRYFVRMIQGTDGLVVDFFAGSGTVAHAVMEQNAADSGTRRYVLVQLPEPLDPSTERTRGAAEYCAKMGRPANIAELTRERLRRAGRKVKNDNPMFAGDLGFRAFKLDSSNIQAWEPDRENLAQSLFESVDHLKTDRTEADILYELLLKLGLDLCVPIQKLKIAGKDVHSIGGGVLLACLADNITREQVEPLAEGIVNWHETLAPAGDTTCVFRDSAFADDVAKTNLAAVLNQHGLANVRSL